MPSYQVTTLKGRLSQDRKSLIARAITDAHSGATGAPKYFAQVIFNEVDPGNYYLGGALLKDDQFFVHGTIRGGRTPESKSRVMTDIVRAVAHLADVHENSIWVYLSDLPPSQMIEFGRVLPEHGKEDVWSAALPAAERRRLESIGTS